MIAPIVSFRAENEGEKKLVEVTPLSSRFLNLILAYTKIFLNEKELKAHILKDAFNTSGNFKTGTEIYLCGLYENFNSVEKDIFLIDGCKDKIDLLL